MIASWGFIYRVRRAIAGLLPIDPHSFVHTVAIPTVVALMLIFIVPLLILSGPPALVVADTIMERLLAERGFGGLLLSDLYGLVWMIPASFLAVGCGAHRSLQQGSCRAARAAASDLATGRNEYGTDRRPAPHCRYIVSVYRMAVGFDGLAANGYGSL